MNPAPANHLSPQELATQLASGDRPLLLDVREYPEYAAGHLHGAQLMPLAEIERRADELPREREIVTICRSGKRSAEAAATLSRLGFSRVTMLQGGTMAWENEGLPVEREERAPWALERQVRFAAGLLVLAGLALSHVWPLAIALSWFVALGLIFAAITDTCAMGMLIARLPWNQRPQIPHSAAQAQA